MNALGRFAKSIALAGVWVAARSGGPAAPPETSQRVVFESWAEAAGIAFLHENGWTAEKHLPETMGSGGLIFDYDNDGWPDIFLVNGGFMEGGSPKADSSHRLYRNERNGAFTDRTDDAGITRSGFGMGACAADYDGDGWTDLYVTSVGRNSLYRNQQNGRFLDVTAETRVGSDLFGSSCAFGDIDNDGDVDLYVTNYVDYAVDNNKFCKDESGERAYCHPNVYNGQSDVLYRNDGGVFTDISREAGIYTTAGKGLGVVLADYDGDGLADIYVANDSVPNFMFHNLGGGRFEEAGMWAGVAVGMDGKPLAGMGTDMADVDGDGLLDVFVTNLNRQTHNLYRNLGDGLFADATFESGVGVATLPFVGFGTAFFDYDNDTDLDLAIADGDVLDHGAPGQPPQAQINLLLENDGTGKFARVESKAGPGFALERVSRSLVVGDLDNDGDLDVLVTNNGQEADLLLNEGGNRNNSVLVRLRGSVSNKEGIGARLRLKVGDQTLTRAVTAGSSYLGQNDRRAHFGLGAAKKADTLEIRWPSGIVDRIDGIQANQILTITEGSGVTEAIPMSR